MFSQSALLTKSFIVRNIRISVGFHQHILIFFFRINLDAVVKNLECRIQVIFCVELHHEKHFETQLLTTVVCEQTLHKVNVFENEQEQNL